MDRYFYAVEDYGDRKEIHISGNVYFNDASDSETDYRLAEYTGLYLIQSELKDLLVTDQFFDYINERVGYLDDITKTEAELVCQKFWNGTSGTKLHIKDVTEETPAGYYWFE